MTSTLTIEEINDLIEQHSERAREAIAQLATYCRRDNACRTPLTVAIQSHNHEIAELLARSNEAINFFPTIDEDLLAPAKHKVSGTLNEENVEETEKRLLSSFGPRLCLQRTPCTSHVGTPTRMPSPY